MSLDFCCTHELHRAAERLFDEFVNVSVTKEDGTCRFRGSAGLQAFALPVNFDLKLQSRPSKASSQQQFSLDSVQFISIESLQSVDLLFRKNETSLIILRRVAIVLKLSGGS